MPPRIEPPIQPQVPPVQFQAMARPATARGVETAPAVPADAGAARTETAVPRRPLTVLPYRAVAEAARAAHPAVAAVAARAAPTGFADTRASRQECRVCATG